MSRTRTKNATSSPSFVTADPERPRSVRLVRARRDRRAGRRQVGERREVRVRLRGREEPRRRAPRQSLRRGRQPVDVAADDVAARVGQRQLHEVRRRDVRRLRHVEEMRDAIGRDVDGRGAMPTLVAPQIEHPGLRRETRRGLRCLVDHRDGAIVVRVLDVQGLVRGLRAERRPVGLEVPVEQVPVQRRPRVVEHPLDHARSPRTCSARTTRTSRARSRTPSPAPCGRSRRGSVGAPIRAVIARSKMWNVLKTLSPTPA